MNLDDEKFLQEADPENALGVIAESYKQTRFAAKLENFQPFTGDSGIKNVVLAGMGGSCLGGLIARKWFDRDYHLGVPFEVVRDYVVPNYVGGATLVICFSVSGDTEETLASLDSAAAKGAKIVVVTSGGKLLERAIAEGLPFIKLDKISQPRYGVVMHLVAIAKIFESYNLLAGATDELRGNYDYAAAVVKYLTPDVKSAKNPAKKLAEKAFRRTPIIYASSLFAPLAYKWKISFNENAKNAAWQNEFSEFNHNEFLGWSGDAEPKPFAIFDLHSSLDNPQIDKRFSLSRKLLGAHRPAPIDIKLAGESYISQILYGLSLADFTTIYTGILNGEDPTEVGLISELKKEL